MKNFKITIVGSFLLVLAALLSGCERIDIKDGIIPDAYLPIAQKAVGVYQGHMRGSAPMTITLNLQGNHAFLQASSDLVDDRCDSRIGELSTIWGDSKKSLIRRAAITFDPNHCRADIWGRAIVLDFLGNDVEHLTVEVSIFAYERRFWDCSGEPHMPCHEVRQDYFVRGRFQRTTNTNLIQDK